MDRFKQIDDKLYQFAEKYNAKIHTKGSSYYGVPSDKIQERRILWMDGLIGKAVMIIPDFVSINFSSPLWQFINFACIEDGKPYPDGKPFWEKSLLDRVEFHEIEKAIDDLLVQSTKNLDAIQLEDLSIDGNDYTIDL